MSSVADGITSVVIADDDELIRMVVRAALESSGFRVIEASDGEAVIREVSERASTADPIRVAVLDAHMPGPGLDAVLASLEALVPAPSIVVLSGDVFVRSRPLVSLDAATRRHFLSKPVELDELIAAVTTAASSNVTPAQSPDSNDPLNTRPDAHAHRE